MARKVSGLSRNGPLRSEPIYDADSWNRTRVTLFGGVCYQLSANHPPQTVLATSKLASK